MFTLFLTAPYVPFTIALALLTGLFLLELVFALIGGTLLGMGSDVGGPDIDGPDIDVGDLDIDFDGVDIDPSDLELPSLEDAELPGADSSGGIASWLGFGKMPALIWLASILMAFGITGVTLQSIATSVMGSPLPATLAALPAAGAALWFTRRFGALFARLIPKTETEALSERHLGRSKGIVTQGTAARGRPAEVRVIDRYGNTHYLRAEPLRDDAQIQQGTEVIVLRHTRDDGYRIVPLT